MIILVLGLFGIVWVAVAVAVGMAASSAERAMESRVALWIVVGLLSLVGLCLAFLVYWFSAFSDAF